MRAALLACLVCANPVLAGSLVDLPTLFQQYADRVVVKDNGTTVYRELSLGDGVVTRCRGDGYDDCTSIDTNDRGETTDCTLVSATRALQLTRQCAIGGAVSRFMLEKILRELGEHVARNAVPPRDWPTLQSRVAERALQTPLPTCAQLDEIGRAVFASRLDLDELSRLQDWTAAPRLPVGGCLD